MKSFYFVDWDNVGLNGLRAIPDGFEHIFVVGLDTYSVKLKMEDISYMVSLSSQNKLTFYSHDIQFKNSSDFILCYYVGLIAERFKTEKKELIIVSGDTGFETLSIFNNEIKVLNIHKKPPIVMSEILKEIINDMNITFPITLRKMVNKIRATYKDNSFYDFLQETNIKLSKSKALRIFINKNAKFIKYTKKTDRVELLEE